MWFEKCQSNSPVGRKWTCKRIFEGEIRDKTHSMLLLAFGAAEDGENRHAE